MQRYFVSKNQIDIKNNIISIIDGDHHHIKNVMKMHVSDKVIVCDNECTDYYCHISNISNKTSLVIDEIKENHNELNGYVSIVQGLVKKAKCDEVLRRIVELGAHEYFNVSMDYSVVKAKNEYDDSKNYLERRETIVKEASEQSERGKLLVCKETISFNEFLKYSNDFDVKLCAYENSGRSGDKSLMDISKNIKGKKIICIFGPEGGFSDKEITKLSENGFNFIGLGKRILRTETAPLYLMSVLGYEMEGEK